MLHRLGPLLIALALCSTLGAAPARAGSYTDFQILAGPAGSEEMKSFSWLAANSETVVLPDANSPLTILMNGSWSTANWTLTWDSIQFDPDPFVSFVGGFSNLAAVPMDFTFSTVSPVAPLAPTLIGGSTTVSVADANFDGVGTLKNITGLAGYSGKLDAADALDMLKPFSISVPFSGGTAVTSQSAGLPGPTIPAGGVAATIGIVHRFNLTGNDNATFNSTFQVAAPEPGVALLLLVGVGMLVGRQLRA